MRLSVSTVFAFTLDIIRNERMLAIVCIERGVLDTVLINVVDGKRKHWQHVVPVVHLRR